MHQELLLSVNVDHVATLRQARRTLYPSPLEVARVAEQAGSGGITVHLREDRRHIQDDDVRALRSQVEGRLNLEIAGTNPMLRIALEIGPHQVTLVPERPDEITTEGGLDLVTQGPRIQRAASTLAESGIAVSVFIDPEPKQIERLAEMNNVLGFEINTDAYSRQPDDPDRIAEIRQVAALGAEHGLKVFAGHGLTTGNVGAVAAIDVIEELNIGHAIVSRAVLVGMKIAVEEMLEAMRNARSRT